jgi:RNA polymerase sigma factor (sigma-70 family)
MTQSHPIPSDEDLVLLSLQGDKASLEQLVMRYKDLLFNLCFKMTRHYEDAADITQEVLIKVITKLASFRQDSSFKTWVYRIAVNHILNYRKSTLVKRRSTFQQFSDTLDGAPDADIAAGEHYEADKEVLYEETKQTCMSGMLLCLDKRHRMAFLLGELFALNDKEGSQVLDVTPENFRMMLSRAKRDLYNFMHDKCGLVNTANPCRCARKTKAFIAAGFVNPKSLRFAGKHLRAIERIAGERQEALDNLLETEYRKLFLGHSYLRGPDFQKALGELLASDNINRLFNLK